MGRSSQAGLSPDPGGVSSFALWATSSNNPDLGCKICFPSPQWTSWELFWEDNVTLTFNLNYTNLSGEAFERDSCNPLPAILTLLFWDGTLSINWKNKQTKKLYCDSKTQQSLRAADLKLYTCY